VALGGEAEALCAVVDRAFGLERTAEERAAAPLAGGIARNGYQCGMVWGSALAAGAEAHRRFGAGARAEAVAIEASRRVVESFRAQNGAVDCFDLTGTDFHSKTQTWRFLLTGKAVGCFRMAARYAPVAKAEIDAALSLGALDMPEPPVSCASLAARGLGASAEHATMAAGFAGGIGLCGGACGALGAAVWIGSVGAGGNYEALDARASPTIARFLEATDGRFECAEIVGRKFESVADHAAFLRDGGCTRLVEALASR
jgi:hypothetical protein